MLQFFHFRKEILNHLLNSSRYDARIAPNYEEGNIKTLINTKERKIRTKTNFRYMVSQLTVELAILIP